MLNIAFQLSLTYASLSFVEGASKQLENFFITAYPQWAHCTLHNNQYHSENNSKMIQKCLRMSL
jgi:hypothetical protein